MPTAAFKTWAARSNAKRVVAAIMQPWNLATNAPLTIRVADSGGVLDGVNHFKELILEAPTFEHSAQQITHGIAIPSFGELLLAINSADYADAGRSKIWGQLLDPSQFAWEGHPIEYLVGGPDLAWSDWATSMSGVMGHPGFTDGEMRLTMYSSAEPALNKPMPPNEYQNDSWDAWQASTAYALGALVSPSSANGHFYLCTSAGTSGASEPSWSTTNGATTTDGGATWTCCQIPDSTEGAVRPIAYGWVDNIGPVLIDETSHVYQVHDPSFGPIEAISAVYVDGVQKTPGTDYTLSADLCTFWLGADPSGQVTSDAKGRKVAGSFIDKPGDIASDCLQTFGGMASGDLIAADFTSYATDVPFPMGIWVATSNATGDVVDDLLKSLLTIWGPNRVGQIFIKRIQAASGSAVQAELNDRNLYEWGAVPAWDVAWKIEIQGARNHTPQSNPDETVTEARRAWLKEAWRTGSAQDSGILTDYPRAVSEGPHQTHLKNISDCITVAGWHLALKGVQRVFHEVEADLALLSVELGEETRCTRNKFGLDSGAPGVLWVSDESYGALGYFLTAESLI